ncbi:condensin-2 complex subunit H2 isoform X2 [Hyalella azteca]|nr:condensin-2 complex subunit H2 isoform X2 [Hyalella azteca]
MPLPSTQDLDARFAVFLNPIRDLTKNWEVDIAKYLEEYLEELLEVQITFDGGETVMNFAEAAMLIQGSATVYSKKVEFLWQMTLQMLELLSSKRKFESHDGDKATDGAAAGGSGKNKPGVHDQTVDFQRIDNVGMGRNITIKEDDEVDLDEFGHKKTFSFLPATPLHLVEKESEKCKNKINLYLINGETFGGKDDFRLNRSYMTPAGLMCLDLPTELLQRKDELGPAEDGPCALSPIREDPELEEDNHDGFSPGQLSPLPVFEDHATELNLGPLEDDAGFADAAAVFPEAEGFPAVEVAAPPLEMRRQGMRRRAAAEEIVALPLKLHEPWKPLDCHEPKLSPRPVRAGRLRRPPPCSCHKTPPANIRKRKKCADKISGKATDESPPIDQHLLKHLPDLANNNNTTSKADLHPALRDQALQEEETRAELLRQRRVCAAAPDGAPERIAETDNLQQHDAPFGLDDDDDIAADAALDVDDAEMVPNLSFDLPDPHTGLLGDDDVGRSGRDRVNPSAAHNDTLQYEPDGEYEALVQQWVAEYIVNAQDSIASSELVKRVSKWRSKISPVLALEEERQAFDIHAYGDKILRSFTSDVGEVLPFRNIVSGLQRNEVARMFLSSLMLANTYNVEPILTEPGEMPMDCLTLRLLSRVRHHEEMEAYVAPSQHNVRPGEVQAPARRLLSSPRPPAKR